MTDFFSSSFLFAWKGKSLIIFHVYIVFYSLGRKRRIRNPERRRINWSVYASMDDGVESLQLPTKKSQSTLFQLVLTCFSGSFSRIHISSSCKGAKI